MSMEILRKEVVLHKATHDLESIFYVLLFFCLKYKGPGLARQKEDIVALTSYCIGQWFQPFSFDLLALKKRDHLEDFHHHFIKKFNPYFADLGDYVSQLWDILFPPEITGKGRELRDLFNCDATHEAMIEVLQAAYDMLPDVDPPMHDADASASADNLDTLASAHDTPATQYNVASNPSQKPSAAQRRSNRKVSPNKTSPHNVDASASKLSSTRKPPATRKSSSSKTSLPVADASATTRNTSATASKPPATWKASSSKMASSNERKRRAQDDLNGPQHPDSGFHLQHQSNGESSGTMQTKRLRSDSKRNM
jgi:hypothetical protein